MPGWVGGKERGNEGGKTKGKYGKFREVLA
jgi:hypothetical protein